MEISKEVKDLILSYPSLSLKDGRVVCSLTNHCMVPTIPIITQYVNGNRYKKAKESECYDFEKHQPYIISSNRHPKRLYCTITQMEINKIPKEVEAHVNGKYYKHKLSLKLTRQQNEGDVSDPDLWIPNGKDNDSENENENENDSENQNSENGDDNLDDEIEDNIDENENENENESEDKNSEDEDEEKEDFGFEEVPQDESEVDENSRDSKKKTHKEKGSKTNGVDKKRKNARDSESSKKQRKSKRKS